ncbi:hypothetical protein, conserved [Trypanosoma brucei gambiense DAL972]|uniref:Uncharacterized protein n=2 Tax=Trypanosoma brucei TaxID=5691 RepID=C9ZMU0_TRYB9|nr:hypothetical protein, conserved [Trypanosoma brucei gambiense DAL972]RHW72797.1 hypothetical protein DPX39_040032400 [Trypanosoma brucei equiperdum]CBH10593.1 hypothetical protein, conserved [Trypanosoma brucei gambiense DAL972]|eukprot:XP_011772882.1 hypothetical protein, conserved [Trypanosoma brucei gambiense DAL972]
MKKCWVFDCAAPGLYCEPRRLLKPFSTDNILDATGRAFETVEDGLKATTWRTHHAFSARCGLTSVTRSDSTTCGKGVEESSVSRSPEDYREWHADFHLRSPSAEPHVLLSVAPHYLPSRGSGNADDGRKMEVVGSRGRWLKPWRPQTAEEQAAYDAAVLGTPLIWEEPLVLSLDCTADGVFLWSEDHGIYGEKVANRCFERHSSDAGDDSAEFKQEAFLRFRWSEQPPAQTSSVGSGRHEMKEEHVESPNVSKCGELRVFRGQRTKVEAEEPHVERISYEEADVDAGSGGFLWQSVLHRIISCGPVPKEVYFAPYVTLMESGDEVSLL